jgi:exosortase H (IPTLxxWG-CTERM-specific)
MSKARLSRKNRSAAPRADSELRGPGASSVSIRFALTFLFLILIFAILTATAAADRVIHQPLSRLVAFFSTSILSVFGTVSRSGTFVVFNGFSAIIIEACDGVLPAYIYLSAVLAFPSRMDQKLWGIFIGIPAIFTINLIRVITLMMVGAYWPDLFERVHIYVWQALVVALSMALWVLWAEVFVRPGPAPGR